MICDYGKLLQFNNGDRPHIENLVEHILIKRCFFLLPEALIFALMQKRDKKIKAAFYLHPYL